MPEGATKERHLWALILLKSYDTDEVNAARVGGVDEGTFRKWAFWFVNEISHLEPEVVRPLACEIELLTLVVVNSFVVP